MSRYTIHYRDAVNTLNEQLVSVNSREDLYHSSDYYLRTGTDTLQSWISSSSSYISSPRWLSAHSEATQNCFIRLFLGLSNWWLLGFCFLWVTPRCLNLMCRRLGTLCLFLLRRWCKQESANRKNTVFRTRWKFEIKMVTCLFFNIVELGIF